MHEGFSTPLDDTLRVFEDYDTKTIQLAKEGAVIEDDPKEVKAYQYIEVDRDLVRAAGTEYVEDILRRNPNGRLWLKLRKLVKRWGDHGGIGSQLYDLAMDENGGATKGEPEFEPYLLKFNILKQAVELECKKALELRREIKDRMEDTYFGREHLYHYMVLNQGHICDLRGLLKFIERDSLFGSDGKVRDDQLWEAYKHWENLPGVCDPDEVEAVMVTVGAVSPDYVVDRTAMEREMEEVKRGNNRLLQSAEDIKNFEISHCISYGNCTPLRWEYFLDERDGLKWALDTYNESKVMLGFMLDGQCNAFGASGWDFLRGDPTMKHVKTNG